MLKRFMKFVLRLALRISLIAGCAATIAFLAERIDEFKSRGKKLVHKPFGIYERFVKRPLDCFLATGALIVFSPILLVLTVVGAIKMGGNPFFTQERPGKNEKIFKLIKFRTMTNKKDENGELLPSNDRLTSYGKKLRSTSLDELPELVNIAKGDMSIVGPRPLLVKYLPLYNEKQKHRHDIRPGLTGYAQSNGRNAITWEEKFEYDVEYVNNISFNMDANIILKTIKSVLKKEGIGGKEDIIDEFKGSVQEYV